MYNQKDMEEMREIGFKSGVMSVVYGGIVVVIFTGFIWLACKLTVEM